MWYLQRVFTSKCSHIAFKKNKKSFETFCKLNWKAAPLLEILDNGVAFTKVVANKADIRTDIPKYRIYTKNKENNEIITKEVLNINEYWNNEMTTFIMGCSFSFEDELIENNIRMYHIENKLNVSMYNTNIPTRNVDGFGKNLVVSMRRIPMSQLWTAIQTTEKYPSSHGCPIYFGNPATIGIKDIMKPDYGDAPVINDQNKNDIPVFWACGITTQNAIINALQNDVIDFVITHSPGHMFITDIVLENANKIFFSRL